jgi:hypothetical protein
MAQPDRAMRVPSPRQGDTEANMISWNEGTLGFSQTVATELYQGELLKSCSDMRDEDIEQVIAAIQRDLKGQLPRLLLLDSNW